MGIRIDGATDLINATDGSLTVDGLSINVTGIVTASGGFQVGSAATIYSSGNIRTVGVITARGGLVVGDTTDLSSNGFLVGTAGGVGVATIQNGNGNAAFAGIVTCNGGISVGSTNIISEINTKATTGKAIAMSMIFG